MDAPSVAQAAGLFPCTRRRKFTPELYAGPQKTWSGLRGSNPSDWLGKPGHYHYAKPALRTLMRLKAYRVPRKSWRTRSPKSEMQCRAAKLSPQTRLAYKLQSHSAWK